MVQKTLVVNGTPCGVTVASAERLLSTLRDRLNLTGAKRACNVGECGACTVLIGGRPQLACLTITTTVEEPILTVEGVAEEARELREQFADQGGFQCGFCTPGQLMSAYAIMSSSETLEEDALSHQMVGNLCRCTGYLGVLRAIRNANAARRRQPSS